MKKFDFDLFAIALYWTVTLGSGAGAIIYAIYLGITTYF